MNRRTRKILAFLLCFAMILNICPKFPVQASGSTSVMSNGSAVERVVLPQNERVSLTADIDKLGEGDYQWQILAFGSMWVDIAGATGENLELSYAMVANLLDDDEATVRCKVTNGEAISYSTEVAVKINYDVVEDIEENEEQSIGDVIKDFVNNIISGDSSSDSTNDDEQDLATDSDAEVATSSNAEKNEPPKKMMFAMARSAPETQKYNIVINYEFADGEQAASPWTATIEAGGSFSETVISPSVLGYTPDQEQVVLSYENISSDDIITVTYQVAEVEYEVIHYLQNVDDDKYTQEMPIEIKTGYTEDPVGDGLEKEYTGFYSLLYDATTEIAADGSTDVEIYYDRYYYLMTFDLAGGYGVEPIYARYGKNIETIGTPVKAGYVFNGWKDESTGVVYSSDEFPYEKIPAKNTEFVAQWTPGNTTYDIVFWYENADDDRYSQAGALYDVTALAGSTVNGSIYANTMFEGRDSGHFTYSHADENMVIKGDGSTVVNVYFSRNEYMLTFKATGLCGIAEHNHTDCTLTCGLDEHEHNCAECCTASSHNSWRHEPNGGKCPYGGEHSHTDNCYSCGEINHTHTSDCNKSYRTNTVKIISAKYGASISNYFPINSSNGTVYSGYEWDDTGNTYSYVLQTLDIMPGNDVTFNGSLRGTDCVIYYFVEVVDGENLEGVTTRIFNGRTYKLFKDVEHSFNFLTYEEEYHPIEGYSRSRTNASPSFGSDNEADLGNSGTGYNNKRYSHINYLYYNRESYNLTFSNYGTMVAGRGGSVQYEAPLGSYEFTPSYPPADKLEPDAYVFDGWYESPFFGDTMVDFATSTMPANDLTLYARWVPKDHKVNIYLTDDLNPGHKVGDTQVIPHRETAVNPYSGETKPVHPDSDKYEFVGWFYKDNDVEKAFDFSMPVTKDLNLYAKWSSNVLVEYTIFYELEDGTQVAESTTGSALAGTTKTFEAKTGDEILEAYQSGYFPKTNSHSLTFDIEDASKNEFTFVYVPREKLPYTVRYLEYDGNYNYDGDEKVLHDPKSAETSSAIITENFEVIAGYMPDAYQKRLVLSADLTENVIYFWYVKDEVHAPVKVIHHIQNIEGDGYTIYLEQTDLNGIINEEYSEEVIVFTKGEYVFDHATANGTAVTSENGVVTGSVTESGLLLELYYNRSLYPYEFKFLEQGTNKILAGSVTGKARYEAQVTQNAKAIDGYTLVSTNAQAINIQIEEGATAVKNVRIFYYTEDVVTINYVVAEGSGTVSPESERVKVLTETASGSTATAAENYHFVGWYSDEECKVAVSTKANFTPEKVDGKNVAATYYAKFEENVVALHYVVVGPTESGTVTPTSEEVKVLTGDAKGSVAAANENYHFVGWYSEYKCENLLTKEVQFVPEKTNGKYDTSIYYAKFEENDVTINYEVVGPEGCGTVNPESETVKIFTGTAAGSTATAADENYRFVGWYSDETCTTLVSSNSEYVPAKVEDKNKAATYYAKFEYNFADLTIVKEGATSADESFIFEVTDGSDFSTKVVVKKGKPVTLNNLLAGRTYTVTEVSDWSWRYNVTDITASKSDANATRNNNSISFELKNYGANGPLTITFKNAPTKNEKWVDGNTWAQNIFVGNGITNRGSNVTVNAVQND